MDASSLARGSSISVTALGSTNAGLGGVPVSIVLPPSGGGGGGSPGTGAIDVIDTGPDQDKIVADDTTGAIFTD